MPKTKAVTFDFETFFRKIYGDRIKIYPLPDIGVGNNSKWGDYVINNVIERFGEKPDLLISGKEERRIDWFDSVSGLTIAELYIPKTIEISASKMREMLVNNQFNDWKDPEELSSLAQVIYVNRPHYKLNNIIISGSIPNFV